MHVSRNAAWFCGKPHVRCLSTIAQRGPLVSFFADPQQSKLSDECRMLSGRFFGAHPYLGDVPLLVEESVVARTFTSHEVRPPRLFEHGDVEPPTASVELEMPVSGVTVQGTAFDVNTDIKMAQANREVQDMGRTLDEAGAAASKLLPLERRVWATADEMVTYTLTRCPLLPNTVRDGDGTEWFRTVMPWYAVRLYAPFDIQTRLPFSPRVQVALRAWSMHSRLWWSVWGSAEAYAALNIALVDQPLDLHVIDEWGDTLKLISAYSCVDPTQALDHVYGTKGAL